MDLSRTFRLSGLTFGAKLELTLLSRSPSVVTVALQLPESEAAGGASSRLVDKFPSSTTLWLVLRKFEAGVAGESGPPRNFTARGIPQTQNGSRGAGRLCHDMPNLLIVGREYTSFTDLQKTLQQIGINGGSVLLKLSFSPTATPLEEAMQEVEQYFKSVEGDSSAGAHQGSVATQESVPASTPLNDGGEKSPPTPEAAESTALSDPALEPNPQPAEKESTPIAAEGQSTEAPASQQPLPESFQSPADTQTQPQAPQPAAPSLQSSSRPITIFAPPSSTTPRAAQTMYNPSDYVPTVDHAKQHQARLQASTANRRLASDAEEAAARNEVAAKRAAVADVEIKVRFPDQSSAVSRFGRADTAAGLHAHVRGLLARPEEPFALHRAGLKGGIEVLPVGEETLIGDLGMVGKVLVTVMWGDGASLEARSGSALRLEVAGLARPIEVSEPEAVDVKGEMPKVVEKKEGGKGGGKGVPKWLKLPGKK